MRRSTWSSSLFENWVDDVKAAFLEFVGTTFFLLLAFGGIQASNAETETSSSTATSNVLHDMYIALSMGFSLLVSVWIFYRASGGVFNPNISLALLLTGIIGPLRFVLYCIAQLVGGITAAALVLALTPGPLVSNTFLQASINEAQGVFIEMFITTALVIAVLMLAAEKHFVTPFAPVGIGLTLFACHLWAVYYTGAGMNVARAFGPAVVTGFPYSSQWVYWVGDGLGSLLGAGFYIVLKQNHYWRLNPRQDTTDHEESPRVPLQDGIGSAARRSGSRSTCRSGARRLSDDPNAVAKREKQVANDNVAETNDEPVGTEDVMPKGRQRVDDSPV
ncbi:aquaporin-like protein [Laetiporus sulphureus 93-53]|uniref:Aquaporin-like protein n=1 Tax=Laetiporus sulphureus 93-53 TaxID=1314785 RepID=A0A165ERJ3_9APHY|nr:aquaporin-like protein [Laetiporus sulphureus 93-53]KZT07618.1 aquaporin-like protein [Laetiporus sulphureus 93-53]